VICLQEEGPLLARYEALGIPVHSFPIPRLYGAAAVKQGVRLARFLRERGIQVLHAHDVYSNAFSVPWARLAGAQVIASRRWWEGFPGLPWRLVSRASYRLAHQALANSPRVAELLRSEGLPANRTVVIPNFLDEHAFVAPDAAELERLRASLGVRPGRWWWGCWRT
jgi:hypothetical protein